MLKLFNRNTPDHPFADLRDAREFVSALSTSDALQSLEDLTHWLESVAGEAAFKPDHRAQAFLLIDEAAQQHVRRLVRDYLGSRQAKQRETRIWTMLHAYWHAAAGAFAQLIELCGAGGRGTEGLKAHLPLLCVRALRTYASLLKWMHLRYGPVDEGMWGTVSRVYAVAEQVRVAQTAVTVYPGVPGESTMQAELLRLFMFAACSPGSLAPVEMEIAERLIAHFSPRFSAAGEPGADTPYWVDLSAATAPRRGPLPPDASGMVGFFGAGMAYEALLALGEEIRASGAIPSQVNLGGVYETEKVLAVVDHLAQHWAPRLPERRYARQPAKSRLTVARGFDAVIDVLQAPGAVTGEDIESWIMEDVSAGGFGARVPSVKGDWLHIGCLLGLQNEGGPQWSVGIIRRLAREAEQQATVGIQVLSRMAVPVELRIRTEYGLSLDSEIGILLPALRADDEPRLLLRPGVYAPGQVFRVETSNSERLLMPTRVVERGDDYELLACHETNVA